MYGIPMSAIIFLIAVGIVLMSGVGSIFVGILNRLAKPKKKKKILAF